MTDESLERVAARYGVSTMYDAAGRKGLIDLELIAHMPDAKVAGRAPTVLCGQDDNLMVPVVGTLDEALEMGGAVVAPGDLIVLDADGALVVPAAAAPGVVAEAGRRDAAEVEKKARYRRGELSYDLDGLRARVEGG